VLSIVASLFYFVVRVIYIAKGTMSPKVPTNLTVVTCPAPNQCGNETVAQLLDGRDIAIGDEIPADLLNTPQFADLNSVRRPPHVIFSGIWDFLFIRDGMLSACVSALPALAVVATCTSATAAACSHMLARAQIIHDETYSYWWSCCVLAAEIGGFILVHISQQMFTRQDTKFYPLPPEHVQKLRDVRARCASHKHALRSAALLCSALLSTAEF
jgi:hypothetical protein